MVNIIVADKDQHAAHIRVLYWEYLQWVNEMAGERYGMTFDIGAVLELDMKDLDKFMPPKGRLLLGYQEDLPVGTVGLYELAPNIGEIKRMYVRPTYRGVGIGRALMQRLLNEADALGFGRLQLDSPRFMKEAHSLYRTMGFKEIGVYPGNWVPKELQHLFVFMEMEVAIARH